MTFAHNSMTHCTDCVIQLSCCEGVEHKVVSKGASKCLACKLARGGGQLDWGWLKLPPLLSVGASGYGPSWTEVNVANRRPPTRPIVACADAAHQDILTFWPTTRLRAAAAVGSPRQDDRWRICRF